jgi:hypothetical protein
MTDREVKEKLLQTSISHVRYAFLKAALPPETKGINVYEDALNVPYDEFLEIYASVIPEYHRYGILKEMFSA